LKKALFTFIAYIIFCTCHAQKEWSNWYNSGTSLLSFSSGHAQHVTDFIQPVPSPTDFYNYYFWNQSGISYSDPVTGKMKFIVSNHLVFGPNYEAYADVEFLRSCEGDEFSYHIIPFQNNPDEFYIVQFQSITADLVAQEMHLQVRCPNAIGLGYSIIDLSKNNGNGTLTTVNQQVTSGLTGQMTMVRHANGKDVWVIVHPYNSDEYESFLVTDAGFQAPVVSRAGPMINGGSQSTYGTFTASHNGKILAGCTSVDVNHVQLFDFDNATGKISNYRRLKSDNNIGKLQFSPDDSKLYYINYDYLCQYDFNQPDINSSLTRIYQSPYDYLFDMQLAPDGKIYISKTSTTGSVDYAEFTATINCPDLPQYACNFNERAFNFVNTCFPDLINDFIHDPKADPVTKFDIGKDTAVCFGSLTLTAPEDWESYKWNTGETTKKITVTKPGIYYVLTGSTGFSCPQGYGYINVTDAAIKLNLGTDTLLCPNTSYDLHINDDYSNILWQNGSNTRDSVITTGNSYIISTNDKNGCFTSDTIVVSFKYDPQANFGNDTTLCNDEKLKLQLSPETNFYTHPVYTWQDGSADQTYTVSEPGKYWGKVTYDGCTVSDTINVSYVNGQEVYLGNDTTLCQGDSLLLQPNTVNAMYLWSTGAVTGSIYVNKTGNYSLKVTNGSCTLSDTIHVTFNNKPVFSLGNDTSLCVNQPIVLGTNLNGSYLWQDSSAANTFKPAASGLYWLMLTQNGCTVSDSINVNFKDLPVVNLGNDTGFCSGKSLQLNAYNSFINTYRWQDNSDQPGYLVTEPGQYYVFVSGNNGCTNSDTINIKVNQPPVFTLGADTTLCDKQTLSYNFNINNAGYLWNDGTKTNSYTIQQPGTYRLSVSQQGCSSSDTISVSYKPLPGVNLGNDTSFCDGTNYTLDAYNNGATYVWQDGNTHPTYTVSKQGNYFVIVDLNGCRNSDTVAVNYISKPVFSLGADTTICPGETLTLNPKVTGGINYKWQDGTTANHYTVPGEGLYSLQVSNDCGTTKDEISISLAPCSLQMPSAFTPNGDGLNDVFKVKYPGFIKQFNMVIYNRWGAKVFETNDPGKGWNGLVNGIPQNIGSYVWIINLTDFNNKTQRANGMVTLLK